MTHLVGLGGCEPSGTLPFSAVCYRLVSSLCYLISDWVSPDLPNFCSTGVLQNPTVWLGIFTGGYAAVFPVSSNLALTYVVSKHLNCVVDDVPYQRLDPHRYLCYIHHFVAPINLRNILSRHRYWRPTLRFLQAGCHMASAEAHR
jgi:hypothetical protein